MKPLNKDYTPFLRKLVRGQTLADAAVNSGITEEEAQAYLSSREEDEDKALRAFADEALVVGLKKLKQIVAAGPRLIGEKNSMAEERFESTDVQAAIALLNAGMSAKKMIKIAKKALDVQKDLFDRVKELPSAWEFKRND